MFQAAVKVPVIFIWASIKISSFSGSWIFAIVIAFVLYAIIIAVILVKSTPPARRLQKLTDRISVLIMQKLNGLDVIRAYNAQQSTNQVFQEANDELNDAEKKSQFPNALLVPGSILCMNIMYPYIYIVGVCITAFFTPNDMQVIYLMETAPIEHRAKLCSITKGIGLLSVSLIGVFRSMFYNPADVSTWRMVYLIPVIIAIAIAIVAWLFTRETPVFLQKRIAWLEKSDEDRRKEEETGNSQKSSIGEAVRYIVHSKQLRMVVIVLFVFSMGIAFSGYTNEIMLAGGHMTDEDINLFLIIEPIVYAICAFFSGFATDALGRKNSGVLFGIMAILGQCVFVFGSKIGIGPVALALANGIMFGGMWSLSDLLFLVLPGESAPTRIRATVMAVISYAYISNLIVTMLVGIFYSSIGSANIGMFQLCLFVPIMLFSIIFLKLKVKETKGTDLNKVGEGEAE